ncbi:MAG: hypothetical protein Q9193_003701, partial [Seirophora villosa]
GESWDDSDGDGYVPSVDAGGSGEEEEAQPVPAGRRRRRTAGHDAHVPRPGKRLSDHDDDDEEGGGGFIISDDSGFDDGGGGGFIPDVDIDDQEISVGNQTPDHVTVRDSGSMRGLEEKEQRFITAGSSSTQDEGGNIGLQPSTGDTASHQNGEARLTNAAAVDDDDKVELVGQGGDVHHPAVPEKGRRGKEAFELPMTDAEVEEARILQELYESGAMDAAGAVPRERAPPERMMSDEQVRGMEEEGGEADGLIIEAKTEADRDTTMVPNDGVEADVAADVAADDVSSEDDDKGSLLSEDPDDEDAEPEWLP